MAYIRQRPNGTVELRIVNKLLPRPYYSTHDTEGEAKSYGARIEAMLRRGQVPQELLATREDTRTPITQVLRAYFNAVALAPSNRLMAEHLQETLSFNVEELTVKWVDNWVAGMKLARLAPGSINKKVGCLAPAVDWWLRSQPTDRPRPTNPLRTLPRGYAAYNEGDGEPVRDVHRDRRLAPGEFERIESVISGASLAGRRPMALPHFEAFLLLFRLITNTGLRLREAYTLTPDQVQFDLRTIHISKSKTGRKRDVPMTPEVFRWMQARRPAGALVFPFWNGEPDELARTTTLLSMRFKRVFEYAGCTGLVEHDLRHEATCRWVLMRDKAGRWLFRTDEVRRITGHLSQAQFDRYLSLRGSDLADRLWED